MANVIEATILTVAAHSDVVFIPRIPLITTEFKRLQFPIHLAFMMSINKINKIQGQSLKVAGVDLTY